MFISAMINEKYVDLHILISNNEGKIFVCISLYYIDPRMVLMISTNAKGI
jgi:hypothetical protein